MSIGPLGMNFSELFFIKIILVLLIFYFFHLNASENIVSKMAAIFSGGDE